VPSQIPAATWYEKACVAIVRNEQTLFQYVNQAGLGLSPRECENVSRTKEFQAVLRAERNKYYKELATDSSRNRNTAVGQLVHAITKLIELGNYDKAVAAIAQLSKLEGWTSDQAQIGIFNDLSSKDIDALRAKLAKQAEKKV
jgi:hypothetical protein